MDSEEGFKPRLYITISAISGLISAVFGMIIGQNLINTFCGGGEGVFPCGFFDFLIAAAISYAVIYALLIFIFSWGVRLYLKFPSLFNKKVKLV